MKYSSGLLGWTYPSSCRHRYQALGSLSVGLIVALTIAGRLVVLVNCEPSAVGSQPGRVSGHQGGRVSPSDSTGRSSNVMDKTLLTSEYSSFDGDGLPGTYEEFKIEVPAAKEECFFQWLKNGTHLHSSFRVLRGADLNLDFSLRSPDGITIQIEPWTRRGVISSFTEKEGVYAICLGNNMSKYTRKLVQFYFQTQFTADWLNYTAALHEYEKDLLNITKSLQIVQSRMYSMKTHQAMHRMHFSWDEYNISQMKETVQKRSIVVSLVIVVVAVFQVLFLRRLFKSTKVTPSAKPRA